MERIYYQAVSGMSVLGWSLIGVTRVSASNPKRFMLPNSGIAGRGRNLVLQSSTAGRPEATARAARGLRRTLDRVLEVKGHHRPIVLEISHFMSLLSILPGSDLIATVPDDIATAVGRHIQLQRIELQFRPPVIDLQQFWHRRMHAARPGPYLVARTVQ